MNYPLVIQRATGFLRKLTNDTVLYRPGAIEFMVEIAEKDKENKPQVYFSNKAEDKQEEILVDTLDEYIDSLEYWITWISSVIIWDDDCGDLQTFIDIPVLNRFKG